MDTSLAKDLLQKLACAVEHAWLASELRHGCNEAHDLDDLLDSIEISDDALDSGNRVQGTAPCDLATLLGGDFCSDLALGHELAVNKRNLACSEDQVATDHRWHIRTRRGCNSGELNAELAQSLLDAHWDTGLLKKAIRPPWGPVTT